MWCGAPPKEPSTSSTENVDNTFDLYRQLAGSCQHGKSVVTARGQDLWPSWPPAVHYGAPFWRVWDRGVRDSPPKNVVT